MESTVFNYKYAKKNAGGSNLKVTLKKNYKGVSLFAKKPIKKGNVVAYYKFLVNRDDDKFKSQKNRMYTMSIYTKKDQLSRTLIGDIYAGSLHKPRGNISYWAYFSNEPSGKEKENVYLDINLKGNYKNRDKVKPGDTMVYKLVALRDIKPGEEICWCYGGAYVRKYKSNCV